jgi:hypothetical protein
MGGRNAIDGCGKVDTARLAKPTLADNMTAQTFACDTDRPRRGAVRPRHLAPAANSQPLLRDAGDPRPRAVARRFCGQDRRCTVQAHPAAIFPTGHAAIGTGERLPGLAIGLVDRRNTRGLVLGSTASARNITRTDLSLKCRKRVYGPQTDADGRGKVAWRYAHKGATLPGFFAQLRQVVSRMGDIQSSSRD